MIELPITSTPARAKINRLPIGLFGSAMGVTGLSVAWQLASERYGLPEWIARSIAVVAVTAFLLMVAGYVIKLVIAFPSVQEEFRHPIDGNLFGTALISLLQLPIVISPFAHRLAQIIWIAGATGMTSFAWLVVSRWINHRQRVAYATPAWIIPIVGVLTIPLALPSLGIPHVHGLMVAALAIGSFFALLLVTLVFSRLLLDPPLPAALRPSLLILVSPFAVGYSAYTVTAQRTDLLAESLFMLTLFLLTTLLGQLRDLPVCCPIRVSWWSVGFPLAACSVAALRFAAAEPSVITDAIALALLALATAATIALLVVTLIDPGRAGLSGFHVCSCRDVLTFSCARGAKR